MPATGSMVADWIRTGLINAVFKQFTFVSKLITALLIARLLLLARFRPAVLRVPQLSHVLRSFLCFHLSSAIVTMPYNAYVPIAYYTAKSYDDTCQQVQQPIYMYSALFWLSQVQNTYTAISPLAVLFLTLERCFVIKLATKPATMARVERWLGWAGIGTLLAAFTASTCFYMDELPFHISKFRLGLHHKFGIHLHCVGLALLCRLFSLVLVPPGWLKRRANANAVGSSRNIQFVQPQQEQNQKQQIHRTASFVIMNPIQLQNNCNAVAEPQMIDRHGYCKEMLPIGTVAQSSEEDCRDA
ncbi:hypothetical protein niasHT_037371 [Heterodera trifolii]|uniref:G-protein coupled receptors family 1 profile domain-containing protein n=1 Tax=Heterodera trifolii TaxID=157864 RepID=A0ABD2J533_9BILA